MGPAAVFAERFRAFGFALPEEAVRRRADGQLFARGWLIAWRWLADGTLEYRSDHRMTEESWTVVAPDGTTTYRDVPVGFTITPPDATDADRERIQAEHQAAWRAHHDAVSAAGLTFDLAGTPADLGHGPDLMRWQLRGEAWQVTDVGPDPRFPAA